MKSIIKILSLLLLVVCMSCEEFRLFDCSNCLDTRPLEVFIDVRLKPGFETGESYHVQVFRGKIEDNIIIRDRIVSESFNFRGIPDQEYSAVATVILDGVEYNITDSARPELVDRSDYCESTCYMVKNKEIDLRIKYY